jgi:gas vesicle protein
MKGGHAMSKYTRPALALVLGGMLLAAAARADERQANELRERAKAIKEKVERLQEEGRHDEAKQLEREVAELFAKADRVASEPGPEPRPGEEIARRIQQLSNEWVDAMIGERRDAAERLQKEIHDIARDTGARMQEMFIPQLQLIERKIAELREQGKGELAERLAGQLREMIQAHRRARAEQQRARSEAERREEGPQQRDVEMKKGPDGRPGPGPDDRAEKERRVQHLRVAAENLNAIGMQDLAQRLNRQAEEIQQSLKNPPPQGEGPPRRMMENIQNELRGINQRLDELNRRLDELMEIARRERK